jgi:hypothetical protein
MASFKFMRGDELEGYTQNEDVDFYLESSGYNSNKFQYNFAFPLQVFAYSVGLFGVLHLT